MTVRAVKWEDLGKPNLDQMIYNLVKPPYEVGIADHSAMQELCYGRCTPPDPIFIPDLTIFSLNLHIRGMYEEWKDGPGKDDKILFLEMVTPFHGESGDKRVADVEPKLNCDWQALTRHFPLDNNHLRYNEAKSAIYCACQLESCFPQNQVFLLSENKEHIRTPKLMNNVGKFKAHKFRIDNIAEYRKRIERRKVA